MSDIIGSDHPLSTSQQALLTVLLDTLVPASEDGRMPSASAVDFDAYLRGQGAEALPLIEVALNHLDESFADQPLTVRCEQVQAYSAAEPLMFQGLLTHVYDCYYQDDRVREAIGMVKGAVFPQGNEVTAGDLSLLDPVINNSEQHQYRNPERTAN